MESFTNQPGRPEYAGFWLRFIAYMIDKLILSVVSFIVIFPFLAIMGINLLSLDQSEPSMMQILTFLSAYLSAITIVVVLDWLYYALMESGRGATLGKMALHLKVTDLRGNRVTFGKASGRYFGKILSSLILSIGYLMAGWTQQKQALHDILAGCLVVRDR